MFNFLKNLGQKPDPEELIVQEPEMANAQKSSNSSDSFRQAKTSSKIDIVAQMLPMRQTLKATTILAGIDTECQQMLDVSITEYLAYAQKLQDHHGPEGATKQLKALNQMVLHWITGQRVAQLGVTNIRLHKSGKPALLEKELASLTALIDKPEDLISTKVALSVLRGYELVRGNPVYDTSTISGITNGDFNYKTTLLDSKLVRSEFRNSTFRELFQEFLKTSRYGRWKQRKYQIALEAARNRNEKSFTSLYYSSTAGPRGFAVGTLGKQSLDLGPKLIPILYNFADHFGLIHFRKELEYTREYAEKNSNGKIDVNTRGEFYNELPKGVLGRLCVYPDKGWKHRLMAICNTWIQIALKPAHEVLMEVLKSIPQDSTWDQEKGASRVRKATLNKSIGSLDIKDATNLIPAVMQGDSLCMLDPVFTPWVNLVSNITFLNPSNRELLTYNTGQPMGLYTSFAGLAHWHNDIYQFSYYLLTGNRKEIFQDYQVLGDDSTCWNPKVLDIYRYLLEILEVPISEGKSFLPVVPTTGKPIVAEFAKRCFVNGVEITGLSTTLCNSVYGSGVDCSLEYMPSLWLNLLTKGWVSNPCLLTFETLKKSIKSAQPLTGMKRIKALFTLSRIEIMYAIPDYRDTEYNMSDMETTTLLTELVENKIWTIQENLGPTWSQVPNLRGKILNESHSRMVAQPDDRYYTYKITDIILKGLIKVYENAALSIKSRETLTMLEFLQDYNEIQDVRKLDVQHVFFRRKVRGKQTKRQKAQSALYRLIYLTLY